MTKEEKQEYLKSEIRWCDKQIDDLTFKKEIAEKALEEINKE